MNKYAAYPLRVQGAWLAMLRFCRDAKPAPVLDKGAKPKVFATEAEAAHECLKHVMAYMNGAEIRGEVFETGAYSKRAFAKSEAERMFSVGGGKSSSASERGESA